MHKWYVVQVFSGQERKVKKALEDKSSRQGSVDFIEQVLVPSENVSEVKNGKQKIVEKRMWPGYILIKMALSDDSWHYVKNIPNVIEFLGGEKPTTLSDHEVESILRDLESKKETVIQKHKINVGDKVKIIEGVFVNFIGTVTDVFHDKGRLSVLVTIFGRETRVDDLEFTQVEEIPEGSEGM